MIKSAIGMMLAFIIAGSADAQSQSVFPPAQPYNPLAGFEQGYDMSQRIVQDQRARQDAQALQNQAAGDRAMRQQLGRMISSGDCQGAMKATLDAGRLDLAREVQALRAGR